MKMNKTLRIMGLCLCAVLAGMYTFNYLSAKKAYDVDGNKVHFHTQQTEKGTLYTDIEPFDKEAGEKVEKVSLEVVENVIYMQGAIATSTPTLFKEVFARNPQIDTLVMKTVDGSIDDEANLPLSEWISKKGLTFILEKDSSIASGGTDFFLAGKNRIVHKGAKIGVHSWGGDGKKATAYPKDHKVHKMYIDYYKALGWSDEQAKKFYFFTIESAPADGMHFMTEQEMVDFNIITEEITNKNYTQYIGLQDIQSTKNLDGKAKKYYTKYVEYTAPNKKTIKILAQDKVSDEQLLYAYSILDLFLTNLTTAYGENIANTIADSGNYLVMPNGSDGDAKEKIIIGQPQYQNETANVGSPWYIENDYSHRDSAYEEIFHFVHNSGIGTTDRGSETTLGSKELATMINNAKNNALPKDKQDWGTKGIWWLNAKESLNEWAAEPGALETEYIICVIDTYYGLWQASDTTALFGEYKGKQRSDLETVDPEGLKVVESFLPKQLNVMYRLDPSFTGIFKMHLDENNKYTYKSQYLDNIALVGKTDVHIEANDNDNIIVANTGNNTIDGQDGNDVVQIAGLSKNYDISHAENITTVQNKKDKTNTITLKNIETIRFKDRDMTTN